MLLTLFPVPFTDMEENSTKRKDLIFTQYLVSPFFFLENISTSFFFSQIQFSCQCYKKNSLFIGVTGKHAVA